MYCDAPMAQWITRVPSKQKIVGSIPTRSTLKKAPVAQWLRRLPSKQKIVGSIPTGGSFLLDSEVYSPRLIPDYLFYNLIYIGPQGRAEIPNKKISYPNLF